MSFNPKNLFKTSKTTRMIFLILCIPIIIVLVFANVINAYYINNIKSLIISNYSNELNSFLIETENNMSSIVSSANYFSSNSDVKNILSATSKPVSDEYPATFSALSTLKTIKNISNLINSIAIYNRNAEFVLTNSGLYDADEYFNDICHYENYSADYFRSFNSMVNTKKILAPSKIVNYSLSNEQIMIPIVLSPIEDVESNSLVILNINANTLFSQFSVYKFTHNTILYMTDPVNNTCFGEYIDGAESLKPQFIKKIISSTYSNSDNIMVNGKKYLSISSTSRSNIWGYVYTVTVPYSDINSSVAKTASTVTIFILLLFISLVLFAYFGTKQLYTPWENLISLIDSLNIKPKTTQTNLLDYIGSSISDMSQMNKTLQHNLSVALPLSQEKYLIDILNGNVTEPDEDLNTMIFRYDNFISISMQVFINNAFISNLTDFSPNQFLNKIYNAISSIFASYFQTFTLPIEEKALYLLLNLKDDTERKKIDEVIESVKNLFKADVDNISIYFYTGEIHKGIDGLKMTHEESISRLLKSYYDKKIQVSSRKSNEYLFTINDENILTNYLITGYTDKATDFLSDIFGKISDNSQKSRQRIYSSIIMTVYKVMKSKGIQFNDDEYGDEFEILHKIVNHPDSEIRIYISELLDRIQDSMHVSKAKIDINEIINYINEHFSEDIYLDHIAQKYNTSTKYISKRIRQHLNITFKDYITQLRIDKAKYLLEETNDKIENISKQVGFYNRSTFIRAFKQKVGLTPSEYRSHITVNRNNNQKA